MGRVKISLNDFFWRGFKKGFYRGFVIGCIVLIIVISLYSAYRLDAQEIETDYAQIVVDFYVKGIDCFAYSVVANGLVYFLVGGDQIGTYTDIDSYYLGGLDYIDRACQNG